MKKSLRCPKKVATFGLILGVLGTTMLFVWGPPQPFLSPHAVIVESRPSPDRVALVLWHSIMSKCGLGLLMFSFMIQAVAVWMPNQLKPMRHD